MSEKRKFLLLLIFGLIVFWFILILFCLPQNEFLDRWPAAQVDINKAGYGRNYQIISPEAPQYMKYFHSKAKPLKLSETLFYGFELDPQSHARESQTISFHEHKNATSILGFTKNSTERFVKSEGNRLFAFNLLVSNRIGLSRPLPDTRNAKCVNNTGSNGTNSSSIKLRASIIICYYNEAPSALLRTISTILDRSPLTMIEEIIIVDDTSDIEYSMHVIRPLLTSNLVKMIRTPTREGLIRARLFGAKIAVGDVLLFLDSHVEANVGWLEPLLSAVQENRTTIACPIIDIINAETLVYSASPMVKGGMNWALNFKWDSVPSNKLRTYEDFIRPIESPTMAGGLFAIDREFFYKSGAYDAAMELWGGENIELSLRTWMCGGRILILPCSRLGHIFRKTRPYGPKSGSNQTDSLLFNSHRTARVWLDEHIENFYQANPSARFLDSGDVDGRLSIRKSLNCNNFTWFLDNIYPKLKNESAWEKSTAIEEKSSRRSELYKLRRFDREVKHDDFVKRKRQRLQSRATLDRGLDTIVRRSYSTELRRSVHSPQIVSRFQIQLHNSNLCIESKGGFMAKDFSRLVLDNCATVPRNYLSQAETHDILELSQIWSETELHELRLGSSHCLDLVKNLPLLRKCHNMKSFQAWAYNNQTQSGSHIINSGGGLCLGVERGQVGEPLIVTICDIDFKHNSARGQLDGNLQTTTSDKFFNAGWRTGPIIDTKQTSRLKLRPMQPVQRWNFLVINDQGLNLQTKNTIQQV